MLTVMDGVHATVLCTLYVSATAANVVLVYAIITRTPPSMRSYSILLLNNIFVDLLSACASVLGIARDKLVSIPSTRTSFLICLLLYIPTMFMMALTYQMLLPDGVSLASAAWLSEVTGLWWNETPERLIMTLSSFFALGSPLINLTFLPPYRRMFGKGGKTNAMGASTSASASHFA
ncbi:hypothetical protein PRIPAC_95705 [Pristionchus pacificus]|uniref:G protein-coupled receptor n=1 Tax=Pristionchus pacificus TaxID=54126 RepID=A0A2A6B3F7_PRIPA|nr:hypothetical protein PRIPAC_95705 [Pristionchus pacificus]|eukprot:PDM60391.1 G protein-coupled receptor [Pristionchus pacificus]